MHRLNKYIVPSPVHCITADYDIVVLNNTATFPIRDTVDRAAMMLVLKPIFHLDSVHRKSLSNLLFYHELHQEPLAQISIDIQNHRIVSAFTRKRQ